VNRIAFLFLLFLPAISMAQRVNSISFTGLTITKEDYLRAIIISKAGGNFSQEQFEDDIFLLRNLNLFFEVEGEVATTDSVGFDLTFRIREARYLYPIISASGFKDQLKLQLGANHINFLGRAQSFGVLYQYYDRHSISVFHTAKRHSNKKTGHELALSKYSTVEPLYFPSPVGDTVSSFNFDNYSVSAGGHYWLGRYVNAGIGAAYMYEDYFQLDDAFDLYNGTKRFNFHKHQLRAHVESNKVEHLFERLDGWKARLYGEWINTYTSGGAPSFLKLTLIGTHYWLIGERGNLASSVRFGTSTNTESPFAPFVLDGFLNVRGIGNRVERGTAELIVNLEYRYSFWIHKIVTMQGAVFSDYGALRTAGQSFGTFFDGIHPNVFLGGGLRLNLNVLYKTCVRLDYSVNPFDLSQRGFTVGFGHFF
jgi:outer membrane protein insertion porin family